MGVNRFFNPSRGQYVSQFVPEELPTGLMINALANKQKTYDDRNANPLPLVVIVGIAIAFFLSS